MPWQEKALSKDEVLQVRFIEKIQKGAEKLAWIFFMGTVLAIFGLFLLIFMDMTLRTTVGFSIEGAIEVSEYILIAIGFLGLGYAQLTGDHVNVDVILFKLSPKIRITVNIIILLVLILFFVVMGHQIGQEAYTSWIDKEYRAGTTLLIPTWPPKFIAFLGTYVLVLSFLVQLSRMITDLIKEGKSKARR
jgi:TRAP-type C4-dicarboxylate transport system permease small subunit